MAEFGFYKSRRRPKLPAMVPYQSTELASGWTIVSAEMPQLQSLTMGLSLPLGSRHESPAQSGAAHFIEHMLFKGTPRRSPLQLAMDVEGAGGSFNAYTSEDNTQLEMRGPSDLMPHLADVLCDMAFNPAFNPEEIEREREVIEEEMVMYQENPGEHLGDLASQALWPEHPLGRPILGTPESLATMGGTELSSFHQEHYFQSGGVIAVAGGIRHQSVVDTFEALLPPTTSPQLQEPVKFNPASFQGPHFLLEDRDIEQAHLAVSFHGPGRHDESRYALKLLSILLGETMSSRLFQEIREQRGLCYHIGSETSLFHECGALQITAGLDAERLDEACQAMSRVLAELRDHGPRHEELEQAKRYLVGQSRVGLETSAAHMGWIADSMLFYRDLESPASVRARYLAVSTEEVHEVAQAVLRKDQLGLALIAPQADRWSPSIEF